MDSWNNETRKDDTPKNGENTAWNQWFQVDGDLDDFIFFFENRSDSSDR